MKLNKTELWTTLLIGGFISLSWWNGKIPPEAMDAAIYSLTALGVGYAFSRGWAKRGG